MMETDFCDDDAKHPSLHQKADSLNQTLVLVWSSQWWKIHDKSQEKKKVKVIAVSIFIIVIYCKTVGKACDGALDLLNLKPSAISSAFAVPLHFVLVSSMDS